MKQLLSLVLIAAFLLVGCSKDFIEEIPKDHISEPTNPVDTTTLEYFYDQYCFGYKVKDTTALIVMGLSQKKENTDIDIKEGTIFLSGTRNGKLWIAGFDTESKEQTFEFVDSKPMVLKYKLHLGYGEYRDVTINKTDVRYIIDNAPNFITILHVYDEKSYTSKAEYVTFFTPSISNTYLTQNRYNDPIEWYNGTYMFSGLSIDDPYNWGGYTCMDQKGDTIFTHIGSDNFFHKGNVFPINYKEVVFFNSDYIEGKPAIQISKRNIDYPNASSTWKLLTPIKYSLADAKYLITKEEITENIWKFTLDLLWYTGEKGNYSYKLNINTGELISNE